MDFRQAGISSAPAGNETTATGGAERLPPYAVLALFCALCLAFRPLLPVDETRYLTVAWEMLQRGEVFVPTLNFLPYHHKPPLLFWLIEASWSLVGVSRAAAMLVVYAISAACLHLTRRVAEELFPARPDISARVVWLMLGSVPFLIYASLILFDLLLTACVLAAFLALARFSRTGQVRYALAFGMLVGLGVLAKGPVVLIHVIWPVVLYPLWRRPDAIPARRFLAGMGAAFLAALIPPALWLGPALWQTDGAFARSLLWEQSAGRISGHLEASHPRPFYFYLALLPVLLLPWLFSPHAWRGARDVRTTSTDGERRSLRLLLIWIAGILAVFSLIAGKQPHYVVPTIPLVAIAFAALMAKAPMAQIRRAALAMAALFALAQAVASVVFFPRYDLAPVAGFLKAHADAPLGFVGFYQGELNFLARLTRPVEIVAPDAADAWLSAHPDGLLLRFSDRPEPVAGTLLFREPYQDGYATIAGHR